MSVTSGDSMHESPEVNVVGRCPEVPEVTTVIKIELRSLLPGLMEVIFWREVIYFDNRFETACDFGHMSDLEVVFLGDRKSVL